MACSRSSWWVCFACWRAPARTVSRSSMTVGDECDCDQIRPASASCSSRRAERSGPLAGPYRAHISTDSTTRSAAASGQTPWSGLSAAQASSQRRVVATGFITTGSILIVAVPVAVPVPVPVPTTVVVPSTDVSGSFHSVIVPLRPPPPLRAVQRLAVYIGEHPFGCRLVKYFASGLRVGQKRSSGAQSSLIPLATMRSSTNGRR